MGSTSGSQLAVLNSASTWAASNERPVSREYCCRHRLRVRRPALCVRGGGRLRDPRLIGRSSRNRARGQSPNGRAARGPLPRALVGSNSIAASIAAWSIARPSPCIADITETPSTSHSAYESSDEGEPEQVAVVNANHVPLHRETEQQRDVLARSFRQSGAEQAGPVRQAGTWARDTP